MKASVKRDRAARVDRAQKLLDGEIGMLVVSKLMGAPLDTILLRKAEKLAAAQLQERCVPGVTVRAHALGSMLLLRAHAEDRR